MIDPEVLIYAIGAGQAIALGYLEVLRRRGPCGSKKCRQVLQDQVRGNNNNNNNNSVILDESGFGSGAGLEK